MATNRNGTFEVDPVSRIEGHLGVKVTTTTALGITNAKAHGNLWRGFENFLLGRNVNDAITFVQRICGVCPVPHGMTSTYAVDKVLGYSDGHITFATSGTKGVPPKAVSIRNLVLGAEFLMSSITHFYHLAAPSYIQGPCIPPWTPYFNSSYYNPEMVSLGHGVQVGGQGVVPLIDPTTGFSSDLWSTVIRSYVTALRIRRLTFEAGALFAGRMPMTSVYVGGGVTFAGTEDLTDRANKFKAIIEEVGLFIIQDYVPIVLALGVLYPEYDNLHNGVGRLGYGSGLGRYLAWGAFPDPDNTTINAPLTIVGGIRDITGGGAGVGWTAGTKGEIASTFLTAGASGVVTNLKEDISNSYYAVATADTGAYASGVGLTNAAYPGAVTRTKPDRNAAGYTYMKAPRWNGKSYEVGPMARMFVSGLFVDNQALSNATGAIGPHYLKYTKTTSDGLGLNPAMINPDIAVPLLKAGLATISVAGVAAGLDYTAVVNYLIANPGLGTTIHDRLVNVYTMAGTTITGAIRDWVVAVKAGASTMDRLRARGLESYYLVQQMVGVITPNTGAWTPSTAVAWAGTGSWISKLKAQTGSPSLDTSISTWRNVTVPTTPQQGWGGTEAPRGALMHQVSTDKTAKITAYQCIVPTTWNGSPAVGSAPDITSAGTNQAAKDPHGAIEAAIMGCPFDTAQSTFTSQAGGTVTTESGVEVLRVAQSFDPCIACAIH